MITFVTFKWQTQSSAGLHDIVTVVGIKGLPGNSGIGIGHRPTGKWRHDPHGKRLKKWYYISGALHWGCYEREGLRQCAA